MSDDPYLPRPFVELTHPEWAADATIYQVNTRQFTPEGTFRAAMEHLPRIRDLGIRIVWLMPVHEIGAVNRKGALGSPYAVKDYYSVNPDLGTVDDLRAFVDAAHELGLKVILDWVANHTAWDSNLLDEHPDWYARDHAGNPRPTPWWDWDDIIDLDYSSPDLRRYMTRALVHWVEDVGVDGYRCDVAGFVPVDFWEQARRELDEVKPVFLLAEWESRDLHQRAFDATYAWSWNDSLHRIAHGTLDLTALHVYYSWNESFWPHEAMRMTFVSNHDKNSWEGTEFEQFGDALDNAIVLSALGEGMPLVYNGQEVGHDKRLEFFDRDPIDWGVGEHPNGVLYRRLFALRAAHRCLWNAQWGSRMVPIRTSATPHVLSFVRGEGADRVLVLLNFSSDPVDVLVEDTVVDGSWTDWDSETALDVAKGTTVSLEPWGRRVLLSR